MQSTIQPQAQQSNSRFWQWFDHEAAPQLQHRAVSFRKMFDYLGRYSDRPVVIVETGCLRTPGNWAGDGQSSLLFDQYLQLSDHGGLGFAVDIDPAATAACRSVVSPLIDVQTGDSVKAMSELTPRLLASGQTIDLLYLDSFDLDWANPTPSSLHHLKELVAISPALRADTLVVVDDSPLRAYMMTDNHGQLTLIGQAAVSGKGQHVAEYAQAVGAALHFCHYQAAWTGFVKAT